MMRLLVCLIGLAVVLLASRQLQFEKAGATVTRQARVSTTQSTLRSEPSVTLHDPLVPPINLVTSTNSPHSHRLPVDRAFEHGDRATFHPHGQQVCASGCAASRHPTEELSVDRFRQLVAEYSSEPIDEPGAALDELLYFGRQAQELFMTQDSTDLDLLRETILQRELARTHCEIAIRVVDYQDEIRASLAPTKVPLDRRHEFDLEEQNLPPLIASGTVKRVGLDYLWTRL